MNLGKEMNFDIKHYAWLEAWREIEFSVKESVCTYIDGSIGHFTIVRDIRDSVYGKLWQI